MGLNEGISEENYRAYQNGQSEDPNSYTELDAEYCFVG